MPKKKDTPPPQTTTPFAQVQPDKGANQRNLQSKEQRPAAPAEGSADSPSDPPEQTPTPSDLATPLDYNDANIDSMETPVKICAAFIPFCPCI